MPILRLTRLFSAQFRDRSDVQRCFRKMATQTETPIIALTEAHRFMMDCMMAVGTPEEHSRALADLLVAADYRGHYSHGMNRLEMYVNDVKAGSCDPCATPKVLNESPATAWVDGCNGLGAVVGNFCMELAIQKAREVGVGWVVAKGSNHYGIAGMYTLQAISQGMLGISTTNTSPFMTPTGAKKAALGTNPISLGAPGTNGDSFVLDMATTAVAVGKIEMQVRKDKPLPEGWALDKEGQVTTDSKKAYETKRLLPLGGLEMNSGFKGYGLGMLVEIFGGILSGSKYGPNIRVWGSTEGAADLGQCFIALNPRCFAPGFEDRMEDLMQIMRCMEPVDCNKPVLVAGDPERAHMRQVDQVGGVRYVPNQMDTCKRLACTLGIESLKPRCCR